MFGNMNDQEHQMTQYIPMESLSSCMKEVRLLKKKTTDYSKDAFCGPAIVEIQDNEVPEDAVLVKKKVTKEAFEKWSLKAKEKWEKD